MASELRVDKIIPTSGVATNGSGGLVQTRFTQIRRDSASTTSTSFIDTGIQCSITPKFATSKILVDMRIQGLLLTAATSCVELALYNGTEGGTYSSLQIWNQVSGYTNASDERIYGGTSTFQYFHDVNNTNNNRINVVHLTCTKTY